MVDYANANARHQQLFWPKNFKPEDAKAPSSTTYTSAPILAIGKRRKTAADVLRQLESNGTDDEEDIQVSDRSDDSLGAIGGRSSKKPAGVVTQSSKHQTSKLVQQKKNNISSKRPLDTSYGSGTGYTRSQPTIAISKRQEPAKNIKIGDLSSSKKGKEKARDAHLKGRGTVVELDGSSSSEDEESYKDAIPTKKAMSSSRSSRKSTSPLKSIATQHHSVDDTRLKSPVDTGRFVLSQSSIDDEVLANPRKYDRGLREPVSIASSSSKENLPTRQDGSAAIRKRIEDRASSARLTDHSDRNRQSSAPFQSSSTQSRQTASGQKKMRNDEDDYEPSNDDDTASFSSNISASSASSTLVTSSKKKKKKPAIEFTPNTKRMYSLAETTNAKAARMTSTPRGNESTGPGGTVKKAKLKKKAARDDGRDPFDDRDNHDNRRPEKSASSITHQPTTLRRAKASATGPSRRQQASSSSSSSSSAAFSTSPLRAASPTFVDINNAGSSAGLKNPLRSTKHSTMTPHLASSSLTHASTAARKGHSKSQAITLSSSRIDDLGNDDDEENSVTVLSSIGPHQRHITTKDTTLSGGGNISRGVPTKPGQNRAPAHISSSKAYPSGSRSSIRPMGLSNLVTSTKSSQQTTPGPFNSFSTAKKKSTVVKTPVVEIPSSPLKRRREQSEDTEQELRREKRQSYDEMFDCTQVLKRRAERGPDHFDAELASEEDDDDDEYEGVENDQDLSHDSAGQGRLLCPFCDRALPERPSKRLLQQFKMLCTRDDLDLRYSIDNPFALRLPVSDTAIACKRHRDELDIIPAGLAAKYPAEEEVDWDWIKDLVENDFFDELKRIAQNKRNSTFRTIARQEWREKGARKMANVRNEWVSFHQELPGFYGQKGFRIIMDVLMRKLVHPGIITSEHTAPLDLESYLRRVLVPEAAVRLIKLQQGCGISEAEIILRESRDYGAAVFGEDLIAGFESKGDRRKRNKEVAENAMRVDDIIKTNGRGAEALKRGQAILAELQIS